MKLIFMSAFLAMTALVGGTPDLTKDGTFGFPQAKAKVLCDRKDVRLSAWNNTTHLYIQAVLWDDNEGDAKSTEAARQVKDGSVLVLDLDNNKKQTAKVDREYSLNADVTMPGLWYSIAVSASKTTPLLDDSKGRGSVRYVDAGKGRKVRIDSYFLPLSELGRNPGDTIRVAYWARSVKPKFIANSTGFKGASYFANQIPPAQFHEVEIANDVEDSLDVTQVPDDPRKK